MEPVAVVIPAHNAAAHLADAIESVLAQTHQAAEVWVVDDGSTDETAAVAGRFRDRVRMIRFDRPHGAAAARNAGVECCLSPLVAFLDADDVAMPDRLMRQAGQLGSNPDAAMTFCAMAYIDERGRTIGDVVEADVFGSREFLGRLLVRNRIGSTSAAMVRRQAFLDLGGFDASLSHNEEYALWLRMAAHASVLATNAVLVKYRIHAGNISRDTITQRVNETSVLRRFDAEQIRRAIADAYPREPDHSVALARVFARRTEYPLAESLLDEIEHQGYADARIAFLQGVIACHRGDMVRAGERFRASLERDPDLAPALNNLAVIEARAGRGEDAKHLLQRAVACIRGYADAAFNLASVIEGRRVEELRFTLTLLRSVLKPQIAAEFGAAVVDTESED
ncbi:MAG: glycosyltransferase [Chromatiaceae bacterium]|nr:glycosyltransferase [Chromatiaceae bacterium]MCP5313790.1 glycosyltransferase [Chromatiaceae bacterium]